MAIAILLTGLLWARLLMALQQAPVLQRGGLRKPIRQGVDECHHLSALSFKAIAAAGSAYTRSPARMERTKVSGPPLRVASA
jgi:hypothetical protein